MTERRKQQRNNDKANVDVLKGEWGNVKGNQGVKTQTTGNGDREPLKGDIYALKCKYKPFEGIERR